MELLDFKFEAAKALNPSVTGYWSKIGWLDKDQNKIELNEAQLESKTLELVDSFTMDMFQSRIDGMLAASDWKVAPDYEGDDQAAWESYRQALRDLPQQIEAGTVPKPYLTEFDELVFDHWPAPPETPEPSEPAAS